MTILIANSAADPFNQALVDALGDLALPTALPYGDALFVGVWEGGHAVRVLVERKRTLDFISSMLNGHHMRQVQAAAQANIEFIYLVVEGPFAPDQEGMTIIPWGGRWQRLNEIQTATGYLPDLEYKRLDGYLSQLDLYLGVRTRITNHVHETAKWLTDLYELFQKPPEEHHTLRNTYVRAAASRTGTEEAQGFLLPPKLVEQVAMQLPGVGWSRAQAISDKFRNLRDLCEAIALEDVDSLTEVEGIGPVIANKIIEEAKNS